MVSQIYNNTEFKTHVKQNTITVQPTARKPSLVKTSLNEKDTDFLWVKLGFVENRKNVCKKLNILHYICVKDNDTTKTANIKIVVLQCIAMWTVILLY